MNVLLAPDKNNYLLGKYHTSSKLLLPGLLTSYVLSKSKLENKTLEKSFYYLNILNIGFHSYTSTSCIITDYIKPKSINKLVRGTNLSTHLLACFGYFYYIRKNY